MPQAKITTKGQITIPLSVRQRMGVGSGDTLEFRETDAGVLITKCKVVSPFTKYRGYLKKKRGKNSDTVLAALRGEDAR